ncbi:Alpha-(1,3)-fucosyltransferase C [Chionoecetes opilio]|uniref:Fucosyltransferase n=1 Tax=Chionoecetes opilio TaxID=41210 RepID=A0A8J4YMM4_CHIOP|nr:Alpha-(1,3)-fucosyltransferase C [Chionoecetes opilio]
MDHSGHIRPMWTPKCDRSIHGECMEMVGKTYKFYLAFENSLCRDYVTEKFFGSLWANVVPVVYGKGNYSAIAPPHSYIDALAFPNATSLANYLIYLDGNDTAYNEYFRWKPYYHQTHDWARKSIAFCDLCERLHHDHTTKSYDLKKWFADDSHCLSMRDSSIREFIDVRLTDNSVIRLLLGAVIVVIVMFVLSITFTIVS